MKGALGVLWIFVAMLNGASAYDSVTEVSQRLGNVTADQEGGCDAFYDGWSEKGLASYSEFYASCETGRGAKEQETTCERLASVLGKAADAAEGRILSAPGKALGTLI